MIRLATNEDLHKIMSIIKNSVKVMNEQGNYQWDESYPLAENYQEDINRNELYLYEENDVAKGIAAISTKEHSEYPEISWSLSEQALTIKRLAVEPDARGKGIADAFFAFAEKLAKENNVYYLKTDTFSKNKAAQQLFERSNFTFVERREVKVKEDALLYYEKVLR